MTKLAIYARYSCDKQNETSLEDQIRRCTELAQRHGWSISQDLIYTDAAASGTEKGDALREKPPIPNYPHHIRNVVWRNTRAMCLQSLESGRSRASRLAKTFGKKPTRAFDNRRRS